jgi:hypothetical protein
MARSRKGSGSVFQRTYRDPKGKLRKASNWYVEFVAGNRTIREATDFTKRSDAAEFLKKRMADALGGKIVLSKNVTYDYLRSLIITDFTNNGQKSLGDLKTTRLPRLDAVFGGTKAFDITTTSVERYKTLRLKDGSAPATVNAGEAKDADIGPSDESSKAPELGLKPVSAFGSETYWPFGIRRHSTTSSEILRSSTYGGSPGVMR